ncbi:MAG: hypothetical protein PUE01_06830 [Clostridiaceae bacterium]|nr:hypothetical protein [Clostridiaceae bacterium]
MRDGYSRRNKKVTRKEKLKKRRRKARILIGIIFLLILTLSYGIWKLYKLNKSRDLQYAIESTLTSGNDKESLLRVQNITLVFNDNETAIIEASGLSKEKPHYSTTIKGYYKKGIMDSWKLEKSYKIQS